MEKRIETQEAKVEHTMSRLDALVVVAAFARAAVSDARTEARRKDA